MYEDPTAGPYRSLIPENLMFAIWDEWKQIFGGPECCFCGHDVSAHTIPDHTLDRRNPRIEVVYCQQCAREMDTDQATCFIKHGSRHWVFESDDDTFEYEESGQWY